MLEKSTGELERELSGCASLEHYLTENSGCVVREKALSEALEYRQPFTTILPLH